VGWAPLGGRYLTGHWNPLRDNLVQAPSGPGDPVPFPRLATRGPFTGGGDEIPAEGKREDGVRATKAGLVRQPLKVGIRELTGMTGV
jgi:hypothetical protein